MKVELEPQHWIARDSRALGDAEPNIARLHPTLTPFAYRMIGSVADFHGVIPVMKLHKALAAHYAQHGSTLVQVGFVVRNPEKLLHLQTSSIGTNARAT